MVQRGTDTKRSRVVEADAVGVDRAMSPTRGVNRLQRRSQQFGGRQRLRRAEFQPGEGTRHVDHAHHVGTLFVFAQFKSGEGATAWQRASPDQKASVASEDFRAATVGVAGPEPTDAVNGARERGADGEPCRHQGQVYEADDHRVRTTARGLITAPGCR